MSRRAARLLLAALPAAGLALAACGGAPRESPAPPPITAERGPRPSSAPAPAPAPTPAPSPAPSPSTAPKGTPPAPPRENPGASAPGAIPPAALPDASAQASPAPADPLKWLQDKEARKADYDRRLEAAEAAVEAARPEVDRWEKNVLAIKNPFLPPPRLSAEDARATQGMTNVERLKYAEDRLAEARAKLSDAQKTLDELKANPVSL